MLSSHEVTREALALPRKDRKKLLARLQRSMGDPNEKELDALWLAEAKRRSKAAEKDPSRLVPLAVVKKKVSNMLSGSSNDEAELTQKQLDKLWLEEAESRIEAAEKGLIKLIPYDEIKREVAQRVWRRRSFISKGPPELNTKS